MFVRTHRFSLPTSNALSTVQREMENLFGQVLSDYTDNDHGTHGWRTPLAIWEDGGKVFLELELAGVKKEDVSLTVHNGVMKISGERKAPEGDRQYKVNNRTYGSFERTIQLPDDIDPESIDARLTDGVLYVVLSKKPEAQPKQIALKD